MSEASGIVIDNKEYTLQGVPPEVFLNGAPSAFFDSKVKLHIVDSVSVCCTEHFKEEDINGIPRFTCNKCHKKCEVRPWIDLPEEGGFYVHYRHQKFPRKGVIVPDALIAVGEVKKVVLNASKLFAKLWWTMPILVIPRVRKYAFWQASDKYVEISDFILRRFYLQPKMFSPVTRELFRVVYKLFSPLKLTERQHWIIGRMWTSFGMFIEFDDSYRYIFQDIIKELDKKSFNKNPAKEIVRLYKILLERDVGFSGTKEEHGEAMNSRFSGALYGIRLALLFSPKVRRMMKKFVNELDIDKMKLDEGDWYQCLIRANYNFGGIPFSERLGERIATDQAWNKENAGRDAAESQKTVK